MSDRPQQHIKRSLVLIMAVATGITVANNYYAQSLLPSIGKTFHLSSGSAGLIVTMAQLGYVLGLVFIAPLGDLLNRRRLITSLTAATACGLVLLGLAPTWTVLYPAALIVGVVSTATQIIVPFAATLSNPEERGKVVGNVMSGLLIGILCARTFAGLIAQSGSWRTVYLVAAGLMAMESIVLSRTLPPTKEHIRVSYRQLLVSLFLIMGTNRVLQFRSLYGLLSFATFSALWTSMAFLLKEHYHYSVIVIGLFGLIGVTGAMTSLVAGRAHDRNATTVATFVTAGLMTAAWIAIWAGARSIWLLIIGIVVLDAGTQGLHVTNQGVIFAIAGPVRSRINSAYMIYYFIGGVLGSALSAVGYEVGKWNGVCIVGGGFAALAVIVALIAACSPKLRLAVTPKRI